jgi:DNA repair exonuclease SbcCD nuclease subunit
MKLLCTSDWHADWRSHGVDRFHEVENAVEETLKTARDEKVDAYFFLGDLCDPDSGSCVFRCIDLALRTAGLLKAWGIPSFWLAGNHDVIEDNSGNTTLTPLRSLESEIMHLAERPMFLNWGPGVLALPYTSTLDAYVPAAFAEACSKVGSIVISHLAVPGVQPGEETTEMPRGREVLYPFEETKKAKLRLQAHYHRQQAFDPKDGGPPILIPGSLARLTFGEEGNRPGFLLVDF